MVETHLSGLDRVREALRQLGLEARIVSPGTPMPTVPLAAAAVSCAVEQIIKTVVFATPDRRPVIGIANGTHRIDRKRLAEAAGVESLRLADPAFVLRVTGFPAGGVSPIGIRDSSAQMIIDPAVLDVESVFGGAGTEDDLLELSTADLVRYTSGTIAPIAMLD